jgi:secondary thiamine-phosphate synthase enzyme
MEGILLPSINFLIMVTQTEFVLPAFSRGFHLITDIVLQKAGKLPDTGLLHLFIMHTSAGICINENADSTVLDDFETVFNRMVPENQPYYSHTIEGSDDMPAHIKSVLAGTELTIPIHKGKLRLGTWQGIYLCEFRNHARARKIVASVIS